VSSRDRPIYISIGRNTNSHRYLVCLFTVQFDPNLSCLRKISEFYQHLFKKFFHVLPMLFANYFHVLLCNFCLEKFATSLVKLP